jgi:hypothetical protein
MNRIDGWTLHAECVIKVNRFVSRKVYGSWSNNAAIIGWGSLGRCGGARVPDYYKTNMDFYND